MAIANYTDLKTAIANFINRSDTASYVDNWILLAEARMVRDLKNSELEVTTTLSVDAQSETLPADFSSMVRATFGGNYPTLDYLPSDSFWKRLASNQSGRPTCYTIEANTIYFAPAPEETLTLDYTYIAKPDIATDTTNRLLTIYPDLYLFACLIEAADFYHDDAKLAKYTARYSAAVQSANRSDAYKGRLEMRLSGVV